MRRPPVEALHLGYKFELRSKYYVLVNCLYLRMNALLSILDEAALAVISCAACFVL